MQVRSVNNASALIQAEVQTGHEELFSQVDGLSTEFGKLLSDWQKTSGKWLHSENPFVGHTEKLEGWHQQFALGTLSDSSFLIGDFQRFSRFAKVPFDLDFWNRQLMVEGESENPLSHDIGITQELLLSDWQKKLDEAQAAWQVEKLQLLREQFLMQINEWLSLLAELKEDLESLGLEPGIWLDLSKGELSLQQIDQLKRWAKYLAEDEGARAICELLGKVRQAAKLERVEWVKQAISVDTPYVDVSSKEEIVGIKLGREIEHTLPSELALLSDSDTSILFDLKFLESRLLCFEMQGISYIQEQQEMEVEQAQADDEKLGPMILCVDTSGSMCGEPEHIAKAMALFLSTQARAQDRKCYLINFSTNIETYELTGREGLSRLINFLGSSFYGGTDVGLALRHALEIMKQEAYAKADILVLSDFIMGSLPTGILNAISKQRENGNTFNSLVIGDCFMTERSRTYFDHEWVFNPKKSIIQELTQFEMCIREPKARF
ncbi:VWA domain-containing protein [Geopsychrobacter electrodiphilus]|uniref:VWA domain-containing protein n=1 Tax=Geopsychrobacter electrodiphilus TaxID=225196 RepID=UPI00037E13D7|nr:VWA domain-containing protein [Geopsychrobacter electrodiphilus]